MKLSVITPTYNHGGYIRDAIDSVLSEDISAQMVVADGYSTDNTREILAGYGERVIWLSEPDRGQSQALNRALDLAAGNILGWLNADEYYLPGTLNQVVAAFEADPSLDALVGDAVLVNPDGQARRLYAAHRLSRPALQWYDCYVLTSSLFIRRRALNDFRFDENLRVTMDWDCLLHLLGKGARFDFIPVAVSAFRVYPEQASKRLHSLRKQEVAVLADRYGLALSSGISLKWVLGRSHHMLRKLLDGGYAREMRFRLRLRRQATESRARKGSS